MKKFLAFFTACITIWCSLAIPIDVNAAYDYYVDVTSEKVNIFTEPYKDSEKVKPVYEGDVLHIIDKHVNSYGNTWLYVDNVGWIYNEHTIPHKKHTPVMCGIGSTTYEFVDLENHNKVIYSGDDICACGAKTGEGTYTRTKEKHFFENKICTSCGYQAVYKSENFPEPVYIEIVDNNSPIYSEPTKYSTRKGTLNSGDITKSTGKISNMYDNVWFALDSGYVFSDHVHEHIHKPTQHSAFPTDTTYTCLNENKHLRIEVYSKLCSCSFKLGDDRREAEEKHNFDSNNYCSDCKYQRPVSIMLPETTTATPETESESETEAKFTPSYTNTTCIETRTIKGEKIDSYIDAHLNSHSYVEVYEKLCPTCGVSYSEGHSSLSYESAYYTDLVIEEHFTDTNEFGESVCTICDFNITRALMSKDDALMQIHLSLGTLGMVPLIGEAFDAIDAALYVLEGEYAEAGLSAMSLIPIAGTGSGALKVANVGSDILRSYDRKKDLARILDNGINSCDDIFDGHKGYHTFASFKYHNGRAGDGMEWHHIVEQVQGKASRSGFDSTMINNSSNLIPLTKEEHKLITKYYGSVYDSLSGITVRDYMSTLSYEEQYMFGLKAMRDLKIIP